MLHLGILFLDQDDLDASEKVLNQVLELDPDNADARFYLALGMRATDRREDAKEMLETACSLDRENANYQKWLGLVFMETGDLVTALEFTKASLEFNQKEGRLTDGTLSNMFLVLYFIALLAKNSLTT